MAEKLDEFVVTEEGQEELKKRLEELRTKRYEVAERIKTARGFGDLSENAEYDEAKQEQGFVESEINALEAKLKNLKVISDDEISTDTVSVGSYVKVHDLQFDVEDEYRIVGSAESDIKKHRLSNTSPVGRGLIGHSIGDRVKIKVPAGEVEYEILEIRR